MCHEVIKVIKGSPQKEHIFRGIQVSEQQENDDNPFSVQIKNSLSRMCPTRWTLRADAIDNVHKNYSEIEYSLASFELTEKNSEKRAKLQGIATHFERFDFLFGVHLNVLIFCHTDNLSKPLQAVKMCVAQGQTVARQVVHTLEDLKSEENFALFWRKVKLDASNKDIEEPQLPRRRKKTPKFREFFNISSQGDAETVEELYKKYYFDALSSTIKNIKDRFDQPDFEMYKNLEQLLLLAARGESFQEEFDTVTQFYGSDFDAFSLQTQLQSFKEEFKDEAKSDIYLIKIVEAFQQMKRDPGQQWKLDYYSQVAILVKLILVLPATNAISERSFSAMRRIKTFLRTTMLQKRLNHLMILHIHNALTDKLSCLLQLHCK